MKRDAADDQRCACFDFFSISSNLTIDVVKQGWITSFFGSSSSFSGRIHAILATKCYKYIL